MNFSSAGEGFLAQMSSALLLHFPDNLRRDGRMKIDCVVTETLSCLVTLPAAAFEGFAHSYLCSVAVLGMVLNTIYILHERRNLG